MKKLLLMVSTLLIATGIFAASPSGAAVVASSATESSAVSGSSNVIYVNMLNVIQQYAGTPAVQAAYQTKANQLNATLTPLSTQVNTAQAQVNAAGSGATKAQINALNKLKNQYNAAFHKVQVQLAAYQQQQRLTFKTVLTQAVSQVLAQDNYSGALVEYNWQPTWTGGPGTDITSQVITTLNTMYNA